MNGIEGFSSKLRDSLIRRLAFALADCSFPASRLYESASTPYGCQGTSLPEACEGPQVVGDFLDEHLVGVCGIDFPTRRPFGIACIYGVRSYDPKAVEHFDGWEPHNDQAGVRSFPSRRRSCLEV